MTLPRTAKVPFGGDYNPEQWPEDVWKQDYQLFDLARIDTVTLGVFDWALTQPAPDVYDFTVLDRIVGRAVTEGRMICLATGTGAHPAWLARAHPEVCRTDFEGRRHRYGQRHNSCPSSPVFRRLSAELARRVARRYAGNPAVVAWHVGNEYGGACYCDLCAAAFRRWLRHRYGSLDTLNAACPYADVPDLESTVRVTPDGTRLRFLLNHAAGPVEVTARAGGVDLLTGDRVPGNGAVRLPAYGIVVLKEER
ncbi:beta-galactosidase [Micromonospora sp. NPDC050187]|uniref:beta-galactosidase n=1 Tax=Micromonospora sp. NPDC050187 TaxID=3364277 RepID=UPI0037AABCA0